MPLLEAYGGRFESAFVILHPFVRVPQSLAWSATRRYPEDAQIAALGARCAWSEVEAHVELNSCAHMNQALLTSIGSLTGYLADPPGAKAADFPREPANLDATEGRFEPLLVMTSFRSLHWPAWKNSSSFPSFPIPIRSFDSPLPDSATVPYRSPLAGRSSRLMIRSCSQ